MICWCGGLMQSSQQIVVSLLFPYWATVISERAEMIGCGELLETVWTVLSDEQLLPTNNNTQNEIKTRIWYCNMICCGEISLILTFKINRLYNDTIQWYKRWRQCFTVKFKNFQKLSYTDSIYIKSWVTNMLLDAFINFKIVWLHKFAGSCPYDNIIQQSNEVKGR